jgi:hypothetical protein
VDASLPQPAARKRRRPFLQLLLGAVALTAALPISASAARVGARSADSFIESIGVNTHTYYTDSVYYQDFPTVEQRLRELGIHHVRENLMPDRPDQYERLNELAAAGIKSTLILGDHSDGQAGINELTSILSSKLRGSVDAVEGPNEYDLNGPSGWMGELAPYQSQLYSAIKSNSALASLPVVGPSLGNTNSDGSNVSGALDYGNIHSYPNGEAPEDNVTRLLSMASEMSGSKPVMATETGYHTALNWHGDHKPVSEAAEATYMPRLFLDYFSRGIVRTFSYELVDEFPNPANDQSESNFGLLHNDLSPKPAFTALKNLTAILADPGRSFAPGKLNYTVSGDQSDLQQVLLQKSDGSYYLALWRDDSVWNNESRTPLSPPSGTVKLDIATAPSSVQEFAPNSSSQPLRTIAANTDGSIAVNVGPQVVIVEVPAGGESVGRIKVWLSKSAVQSGAAVAVAGKLQGAAAEGTSQVKIQRWQHGWHTVAKSHTDRHGHFKKMVRMVGGSGAGASRIRVIAQRAKPSNQVRVRILPGGAHHAPAVALAQQQAL